MSTQHDVKLVGAPFAPALYEVLNNKRKPSDSKQREALDFFQSAMEDCDKKIGKIMDEHQKSVAESAKKLAEYRKRKAREDRIFDASMERRQLNERVRIDSINHRNMLESLRVEGLKREKMLRQRPQ